MKILVGNLFDSQMHTWVNTVNCVGVMGKGVALEFKKRFPDMFREYTEKCANKALRPGEPYLFRSLIDPSVLLFPTKDDWRSPSKLSYITEGLEWFCRNYRELGITSIAFPPLGCGNGGLKWEVVGPIMYQVLSQLPIEVEIYAPYGTPVTQLTIEFLGGQSISHKAEIIGSVNQRINPIWMMILNVVKEVNSGAYTLHVGRTIFQKICYVFTRSGLETGFTFHRSFYGPYSEDVKEAIGILSNANLMDERRASAGDMIETRVTDHFVFSPDLYSPHEIGVMNSIIDLFSRIKNTSHAEMIATVMYAYDELAGTNWQTVTEDDLADSILQWKKKWIGKKETEIHESILDLAMLGWIKPSINRLNEDSLM